MSEIKVGDYVILLREPSWTSEMPSETQQVIRFCVGKSFHVEGIDEYGGFILDVSPEVDEKFGGFRNDLRIEGEYLRIVPRPS